MSGIRKESSEQTAGTLATRPDLADLIREVVTQSRLGTATGWKTFDRSDWRVPGFDMGTGTALMHFAGFAHAKPRPLIMDDDVLAGLADAVSPSPRSSPGDPL
ncbi:MAG: hypothetical protein ACRD0Z_15925 [Acidimicrobiales bacterium]